MTAAFWEGRVTIGACLRMWIVSWIGNFAGCAIFIGLIYSTDMYEGKDWYTLLLAQKKVRGSAGPAAWRDAGRAAARRLPTAAGLHPLAIPPLPSPRRPL